MVCGLIKLKREDEGRMGGRATEKESNEEKEDEQKILTCKSWIIGC